MATNPAADNTSAIALRPARVNIFAKPEAVAAERSSRPQPKAIFDPAAACERGDGGHAGQLVGSPIAHRGVRFRLGGVARLIGLTGVAVVIAVFALKPTGAATIDRSRPSVRQDQTSPRSRGEQARRSRAPEITRRPRTHKRPKRHRLPRHHRQRAGAPPSLIPRPQRQPRPAPSLPTPRRSAPPRPLPAPVPRTAPPEFM